MPETVSHCPLCNHDISKNFDIRQFRGYTVQNRICTQCGLVFQSPRMNADEADEFYGSEYRQVYQGAEDPNKKDLLNQEERGLALLGFVIESIPELSRHLDIGCSAGCLLEKFRDHLGTFPVGVEPGVAYRDFAQTKDLVVYSSLDDLESAGEAKFDIVSMAHVLEHLSDPVDYLSFLREHHLKEDGWLLIEVPNLYCHDSFEIAHLISFSSHTLIQTIQSAGFEVVKIESHGRPRSKILDLYLTLLARPNKPIKIIKPEKNVAQKRQFGMLQRRVLQKLNPKQAWIR